MYLPKFFGKHSACLLLAAALAAGASPAPSGAQGREKPEAILLFALKAYQDGFYDPAAEAFRRYLGATAGRARAAEARYLLAESLRRAERFGEASEVFKEFLERHPKDGRADEGRFRLGEISEKKGNSSAAARFYAAVGKGALRAEAVYRVALLRLKASEWMGAAAALKEFAELAPEDARVEAAVYERARALDRLTRFEEAEAAYRVGIARFPKSERARGARRRAGFLQLRLKKYEMAAATFREVMKLNPREAKSADIRLSLAASLFGQKNYTKAAKGFEDSLSLRLSEDERRTAQRGAAEAWWNAKNYERAAIAYRRLIGEKGKSRLLGRFVRSVKLSGGCSWAEQEALRFALGAAKRGAPLTPPGRLLLAGCLQEAGMKVEAVENHRAVVRASGKSPTGVAASLKIAEILENSGHPKDAAARYEKLIPLLGALKEEERKAHPALLGGVYRGALRAAGIHFRAGDCGSALRLVKAIPRGSVPGKSRAEVASLRAECAFQKGELGEAEIYFGKVLVGARRPVLAARARVRLAAIAEKQGDKKEALRRLQDALPLLPSEMRREARLSAGRLLRELGRAKESRAMLVPFAVDEKADAGRRRAVWLALARDAAAAKEWGEADEALRNWKALSPDEPGEGLALWAAVLFRSGKCPLASAAARDALAAGAGNAGELLRIRASCLMEEKKFAEASAVLEKISEGKPGDAEVALQFAGALERSGEGREAAGAYARFLEKFANHAAAPGAALRLGFLEAGEGNREAALAAYRLAVRSSDLGVAEPARYQLALDLEDRGKLPKALKAYELLAVRNLAGSKWRRASAWRAAAMLEREKKWKRALAYYLRIERGGRAEGGGGAAEEKEVRQAAARARRLEAYLLSVKRREEKMESREPLFR